MEVPSEIISSINKGAGVIIAMHQFIENTESSMKYTEHFARDTQHMWWSGLILKREVKDGNYNIETIDIKTIRREYGKK